MELIINKEDLLYAVNAVEKAISNKNTMPVLSAILVEAEANRVVFRATDLELAIECVVSAQIIEAGTLAVPGRKLSALVRLLPEGQIRLQAHNDLLKISYGDSKLDITCFPTEEFPLLPTVEGDVHGSMTAATLRKLFKQVGIAAAADELRPVFTGLLTEFDGSDLSFVATDTHRLAKGCCQWQGQGQGKMIIPNRVLQETARLAVNDDDEIQITAGKNQIFFSFGALMLTSRLIVGQYPDYKPVIPEEQLFCSQLWIQKRYLIESLERAALIARNAAAKTNSVRLEMTEDGLRVSAEAPDEGRIDELLPARREGKQLTVSFNVKYLMDALRVLDGDKVLMRFSGESTPCLILAEDQPREEYFYLLLPIRINH